MSNSSSGADLIGHLMRRAGFGSTRAEIASLSQQGYEKTVDHLLDLQIDDEIPIDLLRRYHPDQSGMIGQGGMTSYWLYRMINSKKPLQEKIALFWHGVFATGYSKLTQGRVLMDQIDMFRKYGMDSLQLILTEISRDPSMILWLDNHNNQKSSINENYGRELLELFSMGVGNYAEQDITEVARAFTGWTVGNADYMERRAQNDSLWPYGRLNIHFEYHTDKHDFGDKIFLGETGDFSGEDIVDIICKQRATARFIARHMYNFFVADEPPVTQWPYTEPRDPEAIAILAKSYFESNYSIREMLRVLFNSTFFKSRNCWYEKVKSPAELVSGILRLTGEFDKPDPKLQSAAFEMATMGQSLLNPPSVEGWHSGLEWIDTGNLVERINFASEKFSEKERPGIQEMIRGYVTVYGEKASASNLVDGCLDQMGALQVSESTRSALLSHASSITESSEFDPVKAAGEMLRMVATTPEFQKE